MREGDRIVATTSVGTIGITAGRGYRRIYEWGECKKAVTLAARNNRWYGSLGLFYEGAGITWWIPCGGISRAVLNEGQQHFDTEEDALVWLRKSRGFPKVYSGDGLDVEWGLNQRRSQLSVNVWQVMIRGNKPVDLPGAADDKIRRVQGSGS